MQKISALLHAHNDERRLGRCLESLRACDEIVVVDHGSEDATRKIARQYGARVIKAVAGVDQGAYSVDCRHDWILCVRPDETISEPLEASLLEWKHQRPGQQGSAFRVGVREETGNGWAQRGPETRLVNRLAVNWTGKLPPPIETAAVLAGDLLRLSDHRG